MPKPSTTASESVAPAATRRPRLLRRLLTTIVAGALAAGAFAAWRASDIAGALDRAAARLAQATDLVLTHGPIGVTVGRRVGVEVKDAKLVDRRTDRTLLEVSSLAIALELEPILHGEIRFGEILIDHPRVWAERAEDGRIDLADVVDRVIASAARTSPAENASRSPFVTRVAADRIEVLGARLEWLDRRRPGGPDREVFEPVDATLVQHRDTGELALDARARLAGSRVRSTTPGGVPRDTTLALSGSVAGIGQATGLAQARLELDGRASNLDLALAEPWLAAWLGVGTRLDGLAQVEAHASGTLADALGGRFELAIDDARVTVPAVWSGPQTIRRMTLGGRVERHPALVVAEDVRLDADEVHVRLHGRVEEPAAADPSLTIELESPWLDLAPLRHRLPASGLGKVVAYLARVIEEGRARVGIVRVEGRASQLAHLADPANRGVLSGRFEFENVGGTPLPDLDRISGVHGTLVLEQGDLVLEGFGGRSGSSDLGRIDGAVRGLGGNTRVDLRADGAEVALADVRRLLASGLLPPAARRIADDVEVTAGRARVRATLASRRRQPLEIAGEAELTDGAVTVRSRSLALAGISGPLAFSKRELASRGLELRVGASTARVAGSVTGLATSPALDLGVEAHGFAAADVERLLGSAGSRPRASGRVSGTVRIRGAASDGRAAIRAADLTVEGLGIGPPLAPQRVDDLTGSVSFEGDHARFDLASLVWRGQRVSARGTATDLGGSSPRIQIDGRALAPLDLARLASDPDDASAAAAGSGEASPPNGDEGLVVEASFQVPSARYRDTEIRDLATELRFHGDTLAIERATGAALGGRFDSHASIRFPQSAPVEVDLSPKLEGIDAAALLTTLDSPWRSLTGRADLSGDLHFRLPLASHLDAIDGHLSLALHEGRIHEAVALWKVLDLVNFSRWVTSPTGWRDVGLAYQDVRGRVEFGAARIATRDFALHGPTVNLGIAGNIGLADRSVDAVVTVSPLQTFDQVVDPIPVVGRVSRALDLTSYAFRVQGQLGSATAMPQPLERVDALIEQVVPIRRATDRTAP